MKILTSIKSQFKERKIFRFNLLILGSIWIIFLIPLLLPEISIPLVLTFVLFLYAFIILGWCLILVNAGNNLFKLRTEKSRTGTDESNYEHLVIICLYKEPLQLIEGTLLSLANQTIARKLIVTLAFESSTPEVELKIQQLRRRYAVAFDQLLFTVHPVGVAGEIPGKCSNVNYATREIVKQLKLDTPEKLARTIVTTCDADNHFHQMHFEKLGDAFSLSSDPFGTVWQAPLFYEWNSENTSSFSRVTGLYRSVNMLGALIPLQINTMSIQSLSLKLLKEANFYHPAYQMEDILNVVRWMTETRRKVKIRMLRVPLLSGPTSGATLREEIREWRLQGRRWSIGAAEVYHYFLSRFKKIPLGISAYWGLAFYSYYYLFNLVGPVILVVSYLMQVIYPEVGHTKVFGIRFSDYYQLMTLMQLGFMIIPHLLQQVWLRGLGVGSSLTLERKILDILLTPIVLLGNSLVSLTALHELAIKGRLVCGHDPSSKDALGGSEVINQDIRLRPSLR